MSETIICRCSDVTQEEIRDLIRQGYTSFDEIKRILRVGMGPCQGRTCKQLVLRELATLTGQDISALDDGVHRPPSIGIKLNHIAAGGHDDNA